MGILHSRDSIIVAKNETLSYYFLFKEMRRPIHLDRYNEDDLGLLSGSGHSYGYVSIDHHLRQLRRLSLAEELGCALARCYWESWYQDAALEDADVFYIDAHTKIVWSSKPIPKGFISARHEMRPCLKQVFLHGRGGHPLYCRTYPGDTHLTEVLLELVDAFEQAIGSEVIHVIVVDREGLSLKLILALKGRNKAIVTLLRADQYSSEADFVLKSDYQPLVDEELDEVTHRVAEAEFALDEKESLRCALMIDLSRPDKLIALITTVSAERQPDIVEIARWYINRWNIQENSLRSLVEFAQLNLNFGLKVKKEVPNRVLARKIDKLSVHLGALESKIASKLEKDKEEEDFLKRQVARYDKKLTTFLQRKARLELKPDPTRQQKLATQIEDYQQRHHTRMSRHLSHRQKLQDEIDNHRKDRSRTLERLASLNPQAKLYEIDTEKDQIMTHLRIGVHNSVLFARQHYFGLKFQHATPMTLWRTFFSQDGYYQETDDTILVTLKHFRRSELQHDAEEACRRFNDRRVRSYNGKLLQLAISDCN